MDGIAIETPALADADSIARIHTRAWQEAYKHLMPREYLAGLSIDRRADAWRSNLQDPALKVLVARAPSSVLGFAAFLASRDKDAGREVGELQAIYVDPDSWSSGVGLRLWLSAVECLTREGFAEVTLWVLAGNERAIRFYTRAGFARDPEVSQALERGGVQLQEHRYRLRLSANGIASS